MTAAPQLPLSAPDAYLYYNNVQEVSKLWKTLFSIRSATQQWPP